MSYLISGATGSIGRHIVEQLLSQGAEVHALSRKPQQAQLPPAVKVFSGDLTQGEIQPGAFQNVQAAFVFPADGDIRLFLSQAKKAGVQKLVVLSSLSAAGEFAHDLNSPSYLHHRAIEQAVGESGIPHTILRPGTFANNLRFWAYTIKNTGMVFGPYPQSAQALIHEVDIAAVAFEALTHDGHLGAKYALTGPESLTQIDQLITIGKTIGRDLKFQEISPEQYAQSMSQYMPAEIIKMMLDYWSDTVRQPDIVRSTVQEVTGKPAHTLADWAAAHRAEFM